MAMTATIYATDCAWGSASFSNSSDLKVGRTSADVYYRGRLTFVAIPSNWVIQSITLKLTRIDSYATHTLLFGGSTSSGFSAALSFSFNQSISSGTGMKSISLTPYAATIQSYGSAWYIHIRHGSGSNSYTEFNGDEDSASVKPQLVITYVLGTVRYRHGDVWVECEVFYRNGGEWVKVIPYYNSGGTWVQV